MTPLGRIAAPLRRIARWFDAGPAQGERTAGEAMTAPPVRRAVFVDLEGTLVEPLLDDDPASLRLLPGAARALSVLDRAGWRIVVITRQVGLAHASFTRAQMVRLRGELTRRLRESCGIELLDFVVCPHASDAGRPACLCRVPSSGLLQRAALSHGLALNESWLVGDTIDDVEAGRRAGCRTLLLVPATGPPTPEQPQAPHSLQRSALRRPDASRSSWDAAAHTIVAAGPVDDACWPTALPSVAG